MAFSAPNAGNILQITGVLPTKAVGAGYLGDYRSGLWQIFTASGTFVVPATVSKIRVRVLGAGCGGTNNNARGGCGGGWAHGEFNVTPGASYTVTIGAGSAAGASPATGGTSSFGALLSATGGSTTAGGTGTGGDYQATGGVSGNSAATGGGGAGSQLGNGGGSSTSSSGGGGGIANNSAVGTSGGGSAFGPNSGSTGGPDVIAKVDLTSSATGDRNPINAVIRFPTDGFVGGGGTGPGGPGGSGGGGAGNAIIYTPCARTLTLDKSLRAQTFSPELQIIPVCSAGLLPGISKSYQTSSPDAGTDPVPIDNLTRAVPAFLLQNITLNVCTAPAVNINTSVAGVDKSAEPSFP